MPSISSRAGQSTASQQQIPSLLLSMAAGAPQAPTLRLLSQHSGMARPSSEAPSQTGTGPTTNLSFGHAEATILQKMALLSLHHLESPGNATFLSPSITKGRNLLSPERQNFQLSPGAGQKRW